MPRQPLRNELSAWVIVALLVIASAWFSWMFRYEHVGQALFLDRWTGEVVSVFDYERFPLARRDHPGTQK